MDAKLYITEIINELTFVKDSIREDDCTKLIDAIQQSQRVFCYGRACRLFHESLHHAPDAYGQRGLLPDGNHYAELWAAICLSFLPLPVRQHNWWHWREKSTSVWRRCGGVNSRIDTPLSPSLSTSSCKSMPFQNQKILFSARHSRWRRYEQALLVIADALVG